MKYIISVLCPDSPGIVYRISSAIFSNGGNIADMSQTVLKGFFTGVVYAVFDEKPDTDKLKNDINVKGDYRVNIVPFQENKFETVPYDRYILTVKCREQKGIVAGVTEYLYNNNINIESFSAFTEDLEFVIVSEISVPGDRVARRIKKDIKSMGEDWNMSVHLSHENIYLATNTVCPTVRIGRTEKQ